MHLIKSARVYKGELPRDLAHLETLLEQRAFKDLDTFEFNGAGFVPVLEGFTDLVQCFQNGYAFAVRYDEKIVPASVVATETKKIVSEQEVETGRKLSKAERKDIKESVYRRLVGVALTRTWVTTCFYLTSDRYLIVPTTSKKLAGHVMTELTKALGALTATTIYVSAVKGNLTTRLRAYLEGEDVFGGTPMELEPPFGDLLRVGSKCKLQSADGEKFSVELNDGLRAARAGLDQAIASGAQVSEVELIQTGIGPDTTFRFTQDFLFKGFSFTDEASEPEEFDSPEEHWAHEAYVQATAVGHVVRTICDLLEYMDPEAPEQDPQTEEEVGVFD